MVQVTMSSVAALTVGFSEESLRRREQNWSIVLEDRSHGVDGVEEQSIDLREGFRHKAVS